METLDAHRGPERAISYVAHVVASVALALLCITATTNAQPLTIEPRTAPVANSMRSTDAMARQKRVVALLLPTEQPLLRRAAQTVREGVRAVAAKSGDAIELRDCPYGGGAGAAAVGTFTDTIAVAYLRCVEGGVDAIIGPLGRNDVAALASAKLPSTRPTLLLSPSGATPPENFYVLAPDLESEAEAIARQSLEDACRKPILIGSSGATSARISAAIVAHYRSGGVATQLAQHELGPRDRWHRVADAWRRDGVDCAFFTGGSASLFELRPFLRGITVYITSASYENELDRLADWTGVRIADSPFVLDPTRSEFGSFAPAEAQSPTLARLYALGVDAGRIVFDAVLFGPAASLNAADKAAFDRRDGLPEAKARSNFYPPESLDGAIGRLRLRDGQYIRTPSIGEFRGRTPSAINP
jgi:uncharacterized protein